MDALRYKEWIEASFGLAQVELLIIHRAEGLGLLDVELIEDFPKLKLNSRAEKDRVGKLRHIMNSYLWVLGAYELVRLIDQLISNRKDRFSKESLEKLKEVLSIFTEIRMPLTKFQERGKYDDYTGVYTPDFDVVKGAGWKIYMPRKGKVQTKMIYRKDLGDSLLDLLKTFRRNVLREQ